MMSRLLHRIGPLLGLLLFAGALWVLHHQLKAYRFHDILQSLENLPGKRLFAALALTFLSYLVMTGYDALALRYVRHPLPYGKFGLASFISYAFSNNMGFGMIAGGSVRYRLYSAWGLSALEITKVVAFCSLTLWLGFFTLGGVVFLFEPLMLPKVLHLPFTSAHTLGRIFLAILAAYLLWTIMGKRSVRIREWEFSFPSTQVLVAQVVIASMDWALAGAVLYALLPKVPALSFPGFLGIYLLAQTGGLISQVPGGLGVFETIVVLLLSPTLPASEILGVLLAYRSIYYLLPLFLAALLLAIQELLQRQEGFKKFVAAFAQWSSGLVPPVFAFTVFVGGAILLFSGATPAVDARLTWLNNFLPLPVLELSHFFASLAGMGLLLLSRGLQRRLDAAYHLTVVLLGFGVVFTLLKGWDYEEAILLAFMLATLLPFRRQFYRKASLLDQRFSPGWIAGIFLVLLCSAWIGMFSYKHVEYSGDLWWKFAFDKNAPRFLRASVGAGILALMFALARLIRPSPPKPLVPTLKDMERILSIVQQSRQTSANLALLGDKTFLFSQKGNAFIMYGVEGRSWVAMGDPVGPADEWADLLWQYRELSDRHYDWPVFYEVGSEHLHLYLELGLTVLKLGEEARVPLDTFSMEGSGRKGLRRTLRKLEEEGCTFAVVGTEGIPSILPELKSISDGWLAAKNTREKKFSLGFFSAEYLQKNPVGIVRNKDGKILAFTNLWVGADKEELSIDLMRYLEEAPHGIMEYLFIHLILWGKKEGYHCFNLGMAPLSGLESHELAPLWNRLGAFVFRHGEHFYNFQGLRQYKEKFDPEWKPKFLACPGGMALPRILTNLGSLISGGVKGVISK
ncbi:MAG: bifunctional lysylphosphatidylglycerol flippase/synthetase MprF [Deltaproteobacteria bacterium]|nr:bifunctional lysylphosphatidylglycerol flippase/synthetase MprF [Deltaproteobacteria bacterium]